jgi:hypothetical protein
VKLIKLWLLFYSVWVLVTDPSAKPTVGVLVTDPSAKPTVWVLVTDPSAQPSLGTGDRS